MSDGPVTVGDAIRAATETLENTSDTARLDAELLMAHAIGVSRSDLLLRHMDSAVPDAFDALVERRKTCEPIAYITGVQEFYGLDFEVASGVLIPRGDSETLIEAAREAFEDRGAPASILDIGTGSGALLVAALSVFPKARGHAIDKSDAVAQVARRNLKRHGGGRTIGFTQTDWSEDGWAEDLGTFDLVLCNPPYIEESAELDPDVRDFEPASALFAGKDGLDDYRLLIPQLGKLLNEGGVAIFEIGHTQADAVMGIAQNCGFVAETRKDLANRPRCVILR